MKRKDFKLLVENWNNFLLNEGNEEEAIAGSRMYHLNEYIKKLEEYLSANSERIGKYEFIVAPAPKGSSDVLESLTFGKIGSGSIDKVDVKDIVTKCVDEKSSVESCIKQCRERADKPRFADD